MNFAVQIGAGELAALSPQRSGQGTSERQLSRTGEEQVAHPEARVVQDTARIHRSAMRDETRGECRTGEERTELAAGFQRDDAAQLGARLAIQCRDGADIPCVRRARFARKSLERGEVGFVIGETLAC